MNGLNGRVVIVTGAASGIGAATVARLRREGAVVDAWDVATDGLEAVVGEDEGISGRLVDVTDPESVATAVAAVRDERGRIDGLANVAGVLLGLGTLLKDAKLDDLRRTFAVNTDGVLVVMQHVLPVLVDGGGGAIVNVASEAGLHGRVRMGIYGASKAAVVHLTRTVAREHGRDGVRVNGIAPGGVRTPMVADIDENVMAREIDRLVPLGRMAEPDEIAAVIAFLLSEDASYVNGAILSVDGGQMA